MKLSPHSRAGHVIDDLTVYAFIVGEILLFCLLIVLFMLTCILMVQR